MADTVEIASGFAVTGPGLWLVARGQPAAFSGKAIRRRRKGWVVKDRSRLDLVETTGRAWHACSSRPFLTHIPCAAPVSAISDKVLVAPDSARKGAKILKVVPMSFRRSLCTTEFAGEWLVLATAGRVRRVVLEDGETLSVRPDAAVAWTGKAPTGFCPKLSVWDIILPRGPRDLLLTFYGPSVVWIEGSNDPRSAIPNLQALRRRAYVV